MSEVTHPITGVEIRKHMTLARAEASADIAALFKRLRSKDIPGFVIPKSEVDKLEKGGEHAFDVLARQLELDTLGDRLIGTHHDPNGDPLHTDRPDLIPAGADTRFHRIESPHNSTVSFGRLSGHDSSVGTEYREGQSGEAIIEEMHTGQAGQGDITVFELSGDVAHRYSSPELGQKRGSHIRSLGVKEQLGGEQ